MLITPELVQRIYTAIPLIGTAIGATFYANQAIFIVLNTVLMSFIAWEWIQLCDYTTSWRYGYIGALLLGCFGLNYLPTQWVMSCTTLLAAGLVLQTIQLIIKRTHTKYSNRFLASVGGVYFVLNWHALLLLKSVPTSLAIGLLTIISTDTFAYLVGKRWGRHYLPSIINSTKTWEGCVAGLTGALLSALTAAYLTNSLFYTSGKGILVIFLTSVTAISGDLFESAIKRQRGFKDSGFGLPGHGGWLDRFDSLVCALPVFATSLLYLTGALNF